MITLDVDVWKNNQWERCYITGRLVGYGNQFLYTSTGQLYSRGFWRIHGTNSQAGGAHISKERIRRLNKLPPSPTEKGRLRLRGKTFAGPFKKKDLWLAEKMLASNPDCCINKKHGMYFLVKDQQVKGKL